MATLNYAFKELSCKIVYYGCGLCGKTTNLIHIHKTVPQKFRGELVSLATEQDRTLFFDFLPLDLGEVKGFKTKFQLYTVPGQVYYNATRKLVLRGVDGLVFVADSQRDRYQENIDSLENLRLNLAEYGYRLAEGPNDFEGIPWVIQYNKRDMPQISSIEEMEKVVNVFNVPKYESVAVSGQGVKDTLKGISSLVIKKLNAETSPTSAEMSEAKKQEKRPAPAKPSAPSQPAGPPAPAAQAPQQPQAPQAAAAAPAPAQPAAQQAHTPGSAAKEAPAAARERPGGAPTLSVVQRCKARWRGLGLGSANLTLANLSGDDSSMYQLTGKLSFLGVFKSTWSRKLRYLGKEERAVDRGSAKFHRFDSADDAWPELEVLVRDDFDKSLYVNYLGKMGQVQIIPPGKKPVY